MPHKRITLRDLRGDQKTAARFWSKVGIGLSDACWIWIAGRQPGGYGRFGLDGRAVFANRVAWVLTHGPIPDGLDVLHRCDNPPCCNPSHLFLGTHTDNMRDMIRKGRHVALRGEAHWAARITAGDALAIRASNKPHATLAARYGISKHTVHTIRSNRSWTHLAQTAIALTPPGPGDAP